MVLLVLVLLTAVGVCVRLGVWQLHRLSERRAANAALARARERPPVELGLPGRAPAESLADRLARARGTFDSTRMVVIRGQVRRSVPGVHVVMPFRLADSDSGVLVNLGFVPAPDAMTARVESLPPPRDTVVRGTVRPIGSGDGLPIAREGRVTWRRLDLGALRRETPYPLLDVLVVLEPDEAAERSAAMPRRLAPEPPSEGPHLSYAIQWFAFAGVALVGGVALLWRRGPRSPSGHAA